MNLGIASSARSRPAHVRRDHRRLTSRDRPRPRWIALAFLLAFACGDSDDPPRTPTPAPAPEPIPPAPTPEPGAAPPVDHAASAQAGRSAEETQARAREVRRRLREARRALRSGDAARALPLFERAYELAPWDEHIGCETGFVAFRAGSLERASQLVDQALLRYGSWSRVSENQRVPLAMCLYNGGRVAEERGQREKAHRLYTQSLALRENRTVREHLAAVTGAPRPTAPVFETLDALVAHVRSEECEEEDEAEAVDCASADEPVDAEGDSEAFSSAARVHLTPSLMESFTLLAVRGADGWRVAGQALYVYNPGALGITAEGEAGEPAFASLAPGAPLELRLEVSHSMSDFDMGIDEDEGTESEGVIYCGVVDGGIRCALVPRRYHFSRDVSGLADEDEEIEHTPGLPIEEGYRLEHEVDAERGTLTLRRVDGEVPAQLEPWLGTHPLAEVLRSEALALRQ